MFFMNTFLKVAFITEKGKRPADDLRSPFLLKNTTLTMYSISIQFPDGRLRLPGFPGQ